MTPLIVLLAGTAMFVLDFFIVNVAIPATQHDLHASAGAIQWIITGYALALAAGLITGGRLGDRYGRRRMFGIGLALFTVTSAACGLAPNAAALVAARVLQGASAALLAPQVIAIIGVLYTGAARVKALTAYALTLGIAAVAGQLVGGVLIRADIAGLGWRSCYLVNVPVGIVALALLRRTVPESKADAPGRLDVVGVVLVTLGLVDVVLPVIQGRAAGWPEWTWLSLGAGVVTLGLFAAWQKRLDRRGGAPLVAPALMRAPGFSAGVVAAVAFYAGMASFFLVLGLYLQEGRGETPLVAGEVFGLLGLGFLATSFVAGPLAVRFGRPVLVAGGLVRALAMGLLWMAVHLVGVGGGIGWIALPLVLDGAGMGLITGPLTQVAIAGVRTEHAGAASGVLATAQQVGNAVGAAVIGVLFFRTDVAHGFQAGVLLTGALSLAVAVLVRLLPKPVKAPLVTGVELAVAA